MTSLQELLQWLASCMPCDSLQGIRCKGSCSPLLQGNKATLQALSQLNRRLGAIEGSVSGLDMTQREGLKRLAAGMQTALGDAEVSLQVSQRLLHLSCTARGVDTCRLALAAGRLWQHSFGSGGWRHCKNAALVSLAATLGVLMPLTALTASKSLCCCSAAVAVPATQLATLLLQCLRQRCKR